LRQQKRINIGHSDVVYLVSPNILNKKFFNYIFGKFNAIWFYDHTAELKFNEVLSI